MSELCSHFSTLLISHILLIPSFILSHPLYFSYFIFFAPYLLRLLSFLSPLFLTTSLLSISFLTAFLNGNFAADLAQYLRFSKHCHTEEIQRLDDLGMYEILFGSSAMEERESSAESSPEYSEEDLGIGETEDEDSSVNKAATDSISGNKSEKSGGEMAEKRLQNFLKILDEFEKMASNVEENRKVEAEKATEKQKSECHNPIVKAHSQRITSSLNQGDEKSSPKAESSRALMAANNLRAYGSMRKEKEWKRTLACKLFEERHNVDGGEGMDSLWEAYEVDSNKATVKKRNEEKTKKKKKMEEKYYSNEEEDEVVGQLCCLQAIKLSAGKMNNLAKISKAIKGIGWLHHVSKHSKKVHNSNGDRF